MSLTLRQIAMVALLAALGANMASADPSNKWRISVDHSAQSGGEIVFRITPVGGEPFEVTTTLEKATSENDVAKHMVEAFKAQLDKEVYHVERDDWEDVLVKKHAGAEQFDLELARSSVTGVAFDIERE